MLQMSSEKTHPDRNKPPASSQASYPLQIPTLPYSSSEAVSLRRS